MGLDPRISQPRRSGEGGGADSILGPVAGTVRRLGTPGPNANQALGDLGHRVKPEALAEPPDRRDGLFQQVARHLLEVRPWLRDA